MLASQTEIEMAAKAVTLLVNDAIEKKSLASANFLILGAGSHIRKWSQQQCHYYIGYPGVSSPKLVSTELATRRRKLQYPAETPGLLDAFVFFIRNDPLWAPFIIDTAEDYITVDAQAPQNVLQALMMTARCVWEASTESFELFNDALSRGLPARVAFLYGFHTNASTRDYSSNGTSASSGIKGGTVITAKSNHRPWGLLKKTGIQKYLEGSFKLTQPYSEYQSISGVSSMFGPRRDDYGESAWLISDLFDDPVFVKALASFRQSRAVEEGVSVPNPFAPKPKKLSSPGIGEVSFTEYRNVVLDYLINEYAPSIEEEVRNVA